MKIRIIFLIVCLHFISCGHSPSENGELKNIEARFVLPYPVGKAYLCSQGFNSSISHYGSISCSVDFNMPIGTLVTAARAGRVVYILENYSDSDHVAGHENVVVLMHEDSTYSRYAHLTKNGALVKMNQVLATGDTVGLSGNSGNSYHPHLHFDVTASFSGKSDQTIPFDFYNTSSHPIGLKSGVIYEALQY